MAAGRVGVCRVAGQRVRIKEEGCGVMSLRKLVLGILVLWLGLMGIVSGFLCLFCLILVVLWQGLEVSTLILALVCLFCLCLAVILAGRAASIARRPSGKRRRWALGKRVWQSLAGGGDVVPTFERADKWQEAVRGYDKWSPGAPDKHY
jgi:hypothetical protein